MKTLLALTALMLVLAGAVWWKTRPAENIENMPPTSSSDSRVGVATVGMKKGATTLPSDAVYPKRPNTDAGSDHEGDSNANRTIDNPQSDPQENPADQDQTPVAVDPQPIAPPAPAAELQYTVAAGDTLYGLIRRSYGSAPEELIDAVAKANKLADASSLQVGQVLTLPLIEGFRAPTKP